MKKKGRSEKKTSIFGREYIQHYDSKGNKSGTSERKQTLFGTKYTQHYDKEGNRTGRSERKSTFFGSGYTQKYDSEGRKSGTSEKKSTLLGTKYTQHYDEEGNKTDRSEKKQTWFGTKYVQRYGDEKEAQPYRSPERVGSNYGSSYEYSGSSAPAAKPSASYGKVFFILAALLAVLGAYKSGLFDLLQSSPAAGAATRPRIISLAGTHWRGKVGRSPASLEIFPQSSGAYWTARLRYTGVLEDLAVSVNPNGSLRLRGTGFQREAGSGQFALDNLAGELSRNERYLHGSLIDGVGLRGEWAFTKIEGNSQKYSARVEDMLADTSITHWEGKVGSIPGSIDIFPRAADEEWTARGTYAGVIENLTVLVQADGTIVLSGRSYEPQSGSVPFTLSTFYGELSDHGNRMKGLRIDASGQREAWRVSKIARSIN